MSKFHTLLELVLVATMTLPTRSFVMLLFTPQNCSWVVNWMSRCWTSVGLGKYSRIDTPLNEPEANAQTLTVAIPPLNVCASHGTQEVTETPVVHSLDLRGSPYLFSRQWNVLMVEGCGRSVVLKNSSGDILTGCASVCADNSSNTNTTNCYGVGCCQASLLSSPTTTTDFLEQPGFDSYQIALDQQAPRDSHSCNMSAALIESHSVNKFSGKLSNLKPFPTVLEWQAQYITDDITGDNVTCSDSWCECQFPYEGNPYLPNGCQVVRECRKCKRHCNIDRDSSPRYCYCEKNTMLKRASILGFSIGGGLVLLVLGCYWLYRWLKRRKEIKQKAKYFQRNGGLLLQQQVSSNDGVVEKTRIFAVTELEKATDNFSENRILGQGGQGTVYKGMLMDGRIVAIKKSRKVDENQLEQFINEVVILSQINHRNVVKLLGCCLETCVPLLVYEFIPNGTLYHHINDPSDDFHVNWKMRLQIAVESASALAYLHSSSSAPIYHRDIKSSNILLDDKYRAKISDFGISKAITLDQTHVTTCVQGTLGYLDPEYFQSNQFTEKSDVYSFGVVLVELITGKKPICPTETGGWISLAVEFLSHMESSRLSDILDARVLDEGKEEEFMAIADLAKQCLNMNGNQRPTMKEIALVLDGIRSPYVPNLKHPNPVESKHLVTEMTNSHSCPFSGSLFFSSDDAPSASCSIEIQPLMSDT